MSRTAAHPSPNQAISVRGHDDHIDIIPDRFIAESVFEALSERTRLEGSRSPAFGTHAGSEEPKALNALASYTGITVADTSATVLTITGTTALGDIPQVVVNEANSLDELLDNVMLYWLPGTGASSARLYWESFGQPSLDPVATPTGCSIFPKEIFRCSKRWAEKKFQNLIHWNELERGGHFAAFEQPALYVDELRTCFRQVR